MLVIMSLNLIKTLHYRFNVWPGLSQPVSAAPLLMSVGMRSVEYLHNLSMMLVGLGSFWGKTDFAPVSHDVRHLLRYLHYSIIFITISLFSYFTIGSFRSFRRESYDRKFSLVSPCCSR